jgi:hypothetical protein
VGSKTFASHQGSADSGHGVAGTRLFDRTNDFGIGHLPSNDTGAGKAQNSRDSWADHDGRIANFGGYA